MEQGGSDWADLADQSGFWAWIGMMEEPGDVVPSRQTIDEIKERLTTIVNQLIRQARVTDLYVEKIVTQKGFLGAQRVRYRVLQAFRLIDNLQFPA